jgi:hypothetical protein
MHDIKLGVYRHYKNIKVRVIGVAKHSETLEDLVVYEKLEDYKDSKKGSLWVRPLAMFTETVTVDGQPVPRFTYLQNEQE